MSTTPNSSEAAFFLTRDFAANGSGNLYARIPVMPASVGTTG
jgi:hypothetical protein